MQKKILLLLIVMIYSSILPSANLPSISTNNLSSKTELKILSWNIYMLPYISLVNRSHRRAKMIAEKLRDSEYQIIVFQEAFSVKNRNIISKSLLKKYPYQYGPANKNYLPFRTSSGLWIVSKIPLNQLGEIQFSVCKGFDAIARKGAVLFEGYFNGAPFQLLATHLQAENAAQLRSRQCQEIKDKLLNPNFKLDVPQILCGDFNIDKSDTAQYHQMLQTLDASNGELSGATQVTYDEQDNRLAYKVNGAKRIIDYVLVRNCNLIEKMERKVQTFLSATDESQTNLSDHYAMEFSVAFSTSGYLTLLSNQ